MIDALEAACATYDSDKQLDLLRDLVPELPEYASTKREVISAELGKIIPFDRHSVIS